MISHATVERLGQRSGLVLVVEEIARPGHWRGTTTAFWPWFWKPLPSPAIGVREEGRVAGGPRRAKHY
jgi:hypothetical protein